MIIWFISTSSFPKAFLRDTLYIYDMAERLYSMEKTKDVFFNLKKNMFSYLQMIDYYLSLRIIHIVLIAIERHNFRHLEQSLCGLLYQLFFIGCQLALRFHW